MPGSQTFKVPKHIADYILARVAQIDGSPPPAPLPADETRGDIIELIVDAVRWDVQKGYPMTVTDDGDFVTITVIP